MRAALTWAVEEAEWTLGLELFVALENHWATSLPEEGVDWAVTLLGGAESVGDVDPGLVARALRVQGGMQNMLGQLDETEVSWGRALAIVGPLGDDRAVAILLHRLSNTAMRRGDRDRARELAEKSLEGHRRAGPFPKGEAQALTSLAWVAQQEGDLERALELLREARTQAAVAGFRWWEAGTLANIGAVSMQLGRIDDARSSTAEALAISRTMHDRRGILYELRLLIEIAAARGDMRLACTLSGAVETEAARAPVGRWVHSWAREPADPTVLDDEALEEGRRLSLDDAEDLALDRYLTRSIGPNDAGITPYFAKTSSHSLASDTRSRVPKVVRAIFAITFASIGAYFARIFPLTGRSCSGCPDSGVLDGVPEAGPEVLRRRRPVRSRTSAGRSSSTPPWKGLLRASPPVERERQVRLREESCVDGSLRERPEHLGEGDVGELHVFRSTPFFLSHSLTPRSAIVFGSRWRRSCRRSRGRA